jgi:CRISPR-associated exonuclease Cas4
VSFGEEDLLPLSALQHLLFCERQCALIHLEGAWRENALTVEGRHLHERIDAGGRESRGDLQIARSLPLVSLRLGLAGRADVVELHRDAGGVPLPGRSGRWRAVPVESKRGRPKAHRADEVQLCAQGLCLEEMLGGEVPSGALFYGETRHRLEVAFDAGLRRLTEETAERLHALVASGRTPRARREPKCRSCSLLALCLPDALGGSAAAYLDRVLDDDEPAAGGAP